MGKVKHTDPLHRQKAYRTILPTTGKLVLPLAPAWSRMGTGGRGVSGPLAGWVPSLQVTALGT